MTECTTKNLVLSAFLFFLLLTQLFPLRSDPCSPLRSLPDIFLSVMIFFWHFYSVHSIFKISDKRLSFKKNAVKEIAVKVSTAFQNTYLVYDSIRKDGVVDGLSKSGK